MWIALWAACAGAADAPRYLVAPISALKIAGVLPGISSDGWNGSDPTMVFDEARFVGWRQPDWQPSPLRAEIPQGEAEILVEDRPVAGLWSQAFLVVRTTAPGPVKGTLALRLTKRHASSFARIPFELPADATATNAEAWFAFARAKRLQHLAESPAVGAVMREWLSRESASLPPGAEALKPLWHRLAKRDGAGDLQFFAQDVATARAEEATPKADDPPRAANAPDENRFHGLAPNPQSRPRARWRATDDPIAALSGARAIDENLQLDRATPEAPTNVPARPDVPLKDLPGIDIAAIAWKERLKGKNPALDPLAAFVPHDQHAVFFPSPAALAAALEEIETTGFGVLQTASDHASDSGWAQGYRKQLGFPTRKWLEYLPPALATSLAITGSDLNFATGTDFALLIESPRPEALAAVFAAYWLANGTPSKQELVAGLNCRVLRSPDRRLSCYLATLPGALALANSPVQIAAAAETHAGKRPALGGLDEYKFFRDRYRRGDADETAFGILTDAAIRRWCGPQWRIAQRRRDVNRQRLVAAQADWFGTTLRHAPPPASAAPGNAARIDFGPHGAWSADLGSLAFQTPIAELAFDRVTAAEAEAYRQWRDGYQRNWTNKFDPIAFRFVARPDRVATDVSVMPLIAGSRYRQDLQLSSDAPLPAGAGDPHPESLAQMVFGIDAARFRGPPDRRNVMDEPFGPGHALSAWLGSWATVYADADPFWQDPLWKAMQEDRWFENQFLRNLHRLPVGFAVGVRAPFALAGFLSAFRTWVDQTAPNLLKFEGRKHREIGYTAIVADNTLPIPARLTLYYLPLPDQLLVSFNEPLVQRAIDRHLARKDGKAPPAKEWLGNSMAVEGSAQALGMLNILGGSQILPRMQSIAWTNAAVLDELRRLRPQDDPQTLCELGTGERLLCPAGGTLAWDALAGMHASSALGTPFAPKGDRSTAEALLARVARLAGGVTLSDDNLRARFELIRHPAAK